MFTIKFDDYVHNDITIVDHMIKQLLEKSVRLHDHRKYFKVKAFRVGIQTGLVIVKKICFKYELLYE